MGRQKGEDMSEETKTTLEEWMRNVAVEELAKQVFIRFCGHESFWQQRDNELATSAFEAADAFMAEADKRRIPYPEPDDDQP
jgi:hypothetical protein